MKIKVLYKLILINLFFIYGLAVKAQNEASQKIRIEPTSATGGTASQYIDKIKYITLESNAESAFGGIDQLEITDDYFIILDGETKSVLIFEKKGKFHAKMDGKKIFPQAPNIYKFCYDKKTKLIEMNYVTKIYYFDLDGKLVTQKNAKMKNYAGTKVSLGKFHTAFYLLGGINPFLKDSTSYELKVFKDTVLTQKYLPKNNKAKYNDIWSVQVHSDFYPDYSNNDSSVYYLHEYDYNIYKLTPNTFKAAYQFIFPLNKSLPKDFKTDTPFNGKRPDYIMANKDIIFKLGGFSTSGNNIFFKTIETSFYNPSYIFNTETQKLIIVDKIVSDTSTYFLPVTDIEAGGVDFNNHGFIHFDSTYFYTSYSSLVLFSQMEANKKRKPKYPPELKTYFSNPKNKKGNPVLVQTQFKPNL
jgi:hypothetical protein